MVPRSIEYLLSRGGAVSKAVTTCQSTNGIREDVDIDLDFHALRHTCGAWLALAGVHTKTIQSVMRHKDVKLTLDTYGHLFKFMEREALTKMEGLLRGEDSLEICTTTFDASNELMS